MSKSYSSYSFWEQHNGKIVTLDRVAHKLEVSAYNAFWPVEERVITVYATPINKNTKYYKETKAILHDDWSVDVLDSNVEIYSDVLSQADKQAAVVM